MKSPGAGAAKADADEMASESDDAPPSSEVRFAAIPALGLVGQGPKVSNRGQRPRCLRLITYERGQIPGSQSAQCLTGLDLARTLLGFQPTEYWPTRGQTSNGGPAERPVRVR